MRSREGSERPRRATLQMPRVEAEQRLKEQIRKGEELLSQPLATSEALRAAQAKRRIWSDRNREVLRAMVDTNGLVDGYHTLGRAPMAFASRKSNQERFQEEVRGYRSSVGELVTCLRSVLNRLDLLPERSEGTRSVASVRTQNVTSKRVFVVHGADDGAKQAVARVIEKLGLEPIILHEQPDQGRTIMEKFEHYADVAYAVVLLTPDDTGMRKGCPKLRPRARQNVILELGFFMGKLGRRRVCSLYKGDVELPSDFFGVLWVSLDTGEQWQVLLAKELGAAGFDVDLNML